MNILHYFNQSILSHFKDPMSVASAKINSFKVGQISEYSIQKKDNVFFLL